MDTEIIERPKIHLTTLDKILESITYIVMTVAVVLAFILRGKGYKGGMPLMYLFLNLLIIGGFDVLKKHNVYPRVFNFYFSLDDIKFDITTQNTLYKVLLRMFRWIVMLTCLLLTYNIAYELWFVTTFQELIINIPFWVFIIGIAFCLIFYFIKAAKIVENSKYKNKIT